MPKSTLQQSKPSIDRLFKGLWPMMTGVGERYGDSVRQASTIHSIVNTQPDQDARNELSVEDQISYVQRLWDHIAAAGDLVLLEEWQEALLEERMARHAAAPEEARPWREVMGRVVSLRGARG